MRLLFLSFLLFTSACSTKTPGATVSGDESALFEKAVKTASPREVRADVGKYGKAVVVWAGILRAKEIARDRTSTFARFQVEHRDFDWAQYEQKLNRFILSPKSGGRFALSWRIASKDDEAFIQQSSVGDMIVAYGYPTVVRGDVVGLWPTVSIRGVKKPFYNTLEVR